MSPSTVIGIFRCASTVSTYARVVGSVCRTPRAPADDTILVWNPDSIHASARTRCGSTPRRADHASSFASTSVLARRERSCGRRELQLLPDHDRLRGIDAVQGRDRRDRRPRPLRDRGQRVAGPHDVRDVGPGDDDRMRTHRDAVAPDERRRASAARGPSRREMHRPLVPPQRGRGLGAEVAVERAGVHAVARQQELENGDVEAEVAAAQRRASRRAGGRAGRARARVLVSATPTGSPCWRWNAWTAAAVRGPAMPSICAR